LAFVEAVWPAEIGQTRGPPVDIVELGKGVDQRNANLVPPGLIVERRRSRECVHTLDVLHDEERAAEHIVVFAECNCDGMGNCRPGQGSQKPELASHALIGPIHGDLSRSTQYPPSVPSAQREQGV
jgi:hypothetical protein